MSAMVTLRNDGPDVALIRVGSSERLMRAGQSMCVAINARMDVEALQPMHPDRMHEEMGTKPAPRPVIAYED